MTERGRAVLRYFRVGSWCTSRRRPSPREIRFAIWWCVASAALFLYAIFFSAQTTVFWDMHKGLYRFPGESVVPIELPDKSIASSAGLKLSYLGCEFEGPWDDLDEQQTQLYQGWQIIAFHSGISILVSRTGEKALIDRFMKSDQDDEEASRKLIETMGVKTLQIDYALRLASLETTPADVRLFASRRDTMRRIYLLIFKTDYARGDLDLAIFSIRTANFQGFQFGHAGGPSYRVTDELYSPAGDLRFTFLHRNHRGATRISQAEINRVIQTARFVH